MEDWQQWQARADEVAAGLSQEVDELDRQFLTESTDPTFRAFWPRFRDLKERVRTAPAIKLDAKLDLERRLRAVGSRAYKAQEGAYAQSGGRKDELLASIAEIRAAVEQLDNPRDVRNARRQLEAVRETFDGGPSLVPSDRQAVWESWRDTNQFAWTRLNTMWAENEVHLRAILQEAREAFEKGNAGAVRSAVSRFFEALRTHEAKQAILNDLKSEAEALRRQSEQVEQRRVVERVASRQAQVVAPQQGWRTEVARNREAITRLTHDIEQLDLQFQQTTSILEQAMIRGTLVDKRRKLSDAERANKALEQRIEQSEASPLMSAG
ncbi:MAG: hypothetical protein NVS2B16_12990 [Chloroflexota bacterium]